MKPSAALVEVSTASKKPLQFVAQNRRKVEDMLLLLPEVQGDKGLASKLAYIVWDLQGEVRLKKQKIRVAYIEALLKPEQETTPAVLEPPAPTVEKQVQEPEPLTPATPRQEVAAPVPGVPGLFGS